MWVSKTSLWVNVGDTLEGWRLEGGQEAGEETGATVPDGESKGNRPRDRK